VTSKPPLFAGYLGADYDALPPVVRDLHDLRGPAIWRGRASVTRGASFWARLIAFAFRFPPATDDIDVTVTMTPRQGGELWQRQFGAARFWSFLRVQDGHMTERFGPFTFTLGLHVADGQLHFPVQSGRVGPLPFPRFLLPVSVAREYEDAGQFHFDVALSAPITGAPMVHYRGWLAPTA
jgi:hypothetical protein